MKERLNEMKMKMKETDRVLGPFEGGLLNGFYVGFGPLGMMGPTWEIICMMKTTNAPIYSTKLN